MHVRVPGQLSPLYSTALANRLNEDSLGDPDSGWTALYFWDHDTGEVAMFDRVPHLAGDSLYMVGVAGYELRIPSAVFYSRWSDDESRCIVWRTWHDRLPQVVRHSIDYAYGAWHDPADDAIVFDLVRALKDEQTAHRAAVVNAQDAYAHIMRTNEGDLVTRVVRL